MQIMLLPLLDITLQRRVLLRLPVVNRWLKEEYLVMVVTLFAGHRVPRDVLMRPKIAAISNRVLAYYID